MSIYLGGNQINGIKLGANAINNVKLGAVDVFGSGGVVGPFGGNTVLEGKITNYWDMDTSGSCVDSYGVVNGTVNGATHLATAKHNGGYSFTTNDYIDFTDTDFDTAGDFSVGGWVRFDTFGSSTDTRFISKRSTSADGWMIIANTTGKLRVDFYANSGSYYTNSVPSTTFSTGVWYLVGFSYNNTSKLLQCYINGSADGSVTTAGTPTLNNVNLNMGRQYTSYFEGDMDQWKFANGAVLDATDWSDLYASGDGLFYNS